jgi:hypothetical protein
MRPPIDSSPDFALSRIVKWRYRGGASRQGASATIAPMSSVRTGRAVRSAKKRGPRFPQSGAT